MKLSSFFISLIFFISVSAQGPAIESWLQNTTVTGKYYNAGSSTLMDNNILVNCQKVEYTSTDVYVHTKGIPAYPTGPFQDGNPSQAEDQDAIFKIPLNPIENTGTKTASTPGNIGVFINGVALFDYRDGVAWDNTNNRLCGGPGNPPCPGGMGTTQDWNRDAIPAEMAGFDCSKAHPAMGNYHHHQNPTAFKLDKTVVSTVCNLYDADGLYVIDETKHSPLIGFAYDGFPIYGAYAYKNTDGTGGIVRMKSSYNKKNITTRTNGPAVDATYFLGYFREDYEYVANSDPDYLDEHNGRFCITPEYPNGIYCYFATVDANHNSVYPYVVGPTFYGVYANRKVTNVPNGTTVYTASQNTFIVSPTNLSIASAANSTGDMNVTANAAWAASSNQSWLTLSPNSGSTNATVTATAEANTVSSSRTATVTFSMNGLADQSVIVTQQSLSGGGSSILTADKKVLDISIVPNPASDLIAIQVLGLNRSQLNIELTDIEGRLIQSSMMSLGQTISYFDVQTLYNGFYFLKVSDRRNSITEKIQIKR